MKKLLSILLAAAVLLAAPVTVRAAEGAVTVTDGASFTIDIGGVVYEYRLPAVSIPGVDMTGLNDGIYDVFYPDIAASRQEMEENGFPFTSGGMSYSWSVHGDVLSLVIQNFESPEASGDNVYTVYNLNAVTGDALSDGELLDRVGFSREDYDAALEKTLRNAHHKFNETIYAQGTAEQKAMADDCLAQTLEAGNVGAAKPFLGARGHLCAASGLCTPAGSGYCTQLLDLEAAASFSYKPWAPEGGAVTVSAGAPASSGTSKSAPDASMGDYSAAAVEDAYSYSYDESWGEQWYRVPRINWPGDNIDSINQTIWEDLYENDIWGVSAAMDDLRQGYSAEPYGLEYDWAVNGDVLSLWTVRLYSGDCNRYAVYNVSLSQSRRLTDRELLDAAGVSQEDFYAASARALADAFEQRCEWAPEDATKAQLRSWNNADSNIRAVRPYLDGNGDLCVIGTVFTPAGAGEFEQELTVMGAGELAGTIESAGLEQPTPDERVVWFIEHSDSEYLSESDIQGFDKHMCLYARNGIFARSGRMFQDPDLQAYFSQFDWYVPSIAPEQFTEYDMNDYQTKNAAMILAYEERLS